MLPLEVVYDYDPTPLPPTAASAESSKATVAMQQASVPRGKSADNSSGVNALDYYSVYRVGKNG